MEQDIAIQRCFNSILHEVHVIKQNNATQRCFNSILHEVRHRTGYRNSTLF
jgi:hypothetical protein